MTVAIVRPRCKVPGCYENIPSDKLMCDVHWGRLEMKTMLNLFETLQSAYEEAGRITVSV